MSDVSLSQKERNKTQNLKVENPHKHTVLKVVSFFLLGWCLESTKHGFAESYGVLVLGSVSFDHRDVRVSRSAVSAAGS